MSPEQIQKLRIVVADDDLDDHYFIKEAIEDVCPGFLYQSVYNGLELMKLLTEPDKKNKPDLILMDLNMPLLNGFGALSQIKASEELRQVPIYILSTSRFDYDKQKALELGAKDFYTKPNNYQDLKSIIREIYIKTIEGR